MTDYSVTLVELTKIFGRRLVFEKINYKFASGSIYGLAGSNGSGKSTLSKIIAGVISATRGNVVHKLNGKQIIKEKLHDHVGFVSPYLVLYDEFTAEENLKHFAKIRGIHYDAEHNNLLLKTFGLYKRRKDLLKGYSSGMLQRMKFVFALQHHPQLLLLDEPTSNLDNEGKETVYEVIKKYQKENLVIIASNEDNDLAICNNILSIENFKNKKGNE